MSLVVFLGGSEVNKEVILIGIGERVVMCNAPSVTFIDVPLNALPPSAVVSDVFIGILVVNIIVVGGAPVIDGRC